MPSKKKTTKVALRRKAAEVVSASSVQPEYGDGYPTAYSNFASVSHTPTELCIDFCLLAPPHRVNIEKKEVRVPVVSRVMIPVNMADKLIIAIRAQAEKAKKEIDSVNAEKAKK